MNHCYLADDFSKVNLPDNVIKAPETLLNGNQIKEWVNSIRGTDTMFATTSLYLIRELELQRVDTVYHYYKEDGEMIMVVGEVTDLPCKIEILMRELEQSDRYINDNNLRGVRS